MAYFPRSPYDIYAYTYVTEIKKARRKILESKQWLKSLTCGTMDDFVSALFCVSKISMVPFTAKRTILINKLKKGESVLMTELVT